MMRYLALATDYDGTLARHGHVDEPTIEALGRLRVSGRKLLLVTGRVLPELREIFPRLEYFDLVVAENGALLFWPESGETRRLGEVPPPGLAQGLRARGAPVVEGEVIVATWRPHEVHALEIIRDLGQEMQVIFNKDAVMILPSGVNKATGLAVALEALGLSPHNLVGVGDAENDHAFLALCEFSVAVDNALPTLKERADLVTLADHGAGVAELIEALVEDDLRQFAARLTRHAVALGQPIDGLGDAAGEPASAAVSPSVAEGEPPAGPFTIPAYGETILLAGASGSGKTTFAGGILERLAEQQYQLCIVDPEGDYDSFQQAVVLGGPERAPTLDEILDVLKTPASNVVVNLLGVPLPDRPAFFDRLAPRLKELRARTGRPHWIVVDEAHHLMPPLWEASRLGADELVNLLLITVHPDHLTEPALRAVTRLLVTGEHAAEAVADFRRLRGEPATPPPPAAPIEPGQALLWSSPAASRSADGNGAGPGEGALRVLASLPAKAERRRHLRKYVEGELAPEQSFYFRGPHGRLNLRAQNLMLFLQLADGVDDDTWHYHRRRHDYSEWVRVMIKDAEMADEIRRVEDDGALDAAESRGRIRAAIETRYTAAA